MRATTSDSPRRERASKKNAPRKRGKKTTTYCTRTLSLGPKCACILRKRFGVDTCFYVGQVFACTAASIAYILFLYQHRSILRTTVSPFRRSTLRATRSRGLSWPLVHKFYAREFDTKGGEFQQECQTSQCETRC